MDNMLLRGVTASEMADLGHRLYALSLVHRDPEYITGPEDEPVLWLLDTRIPMLTGNIAREVGNVLSKRLREQGIRQVAGHGFGRILLSV